MLRHDTVTTQPRVVKEALSVGSHDDNALGSEALPSAHFEFLTARHAVIAGNCSLCQLEKECDTSLRLRPAAEDSTPKRDDTSACRPSGDFVCSPVSIRITKEHSGSGIARPPAMSQGTFLKYLPVRFAACKVSKIGSRDGALQDTNSNV